jgi:hypothetical protein
VLLPLGTSFLVGLAGFHRTLSGTWPRARLWAALAVAALVTPAALWVSGAAALASAPLVLLALILWEGHRAQEGPELETRWMRARGSVFACEVRPCSCRSRRCRRRHQRRAVRDHGPCRDLVLVEHRSPRPMAVVWLVHSSAILGSSVLLFSPTGPDEEAHGGL